MSLSFNDINIGDKVRLRDTDLPVWTYKYKGVIGHICHISRVDEGEFTMVEVVFHMPDGTRSNAIPCYLSRLELATRPYTVEDWTID